MGWMMARSFVGRHSFWGGEETSEKAKQEL
jgi:hypothetical protein